MQKTSSSEFQKWCDKSLELNNSVEDEVVLVKALKQIGYKVDSIYDVKDCEELRQFLSDLIVKRHTCGIETSTKYISAVFRLLAYVEFFETRKNEEKAGLNISNRNKTIDSLTVAYYLSRVDKKALNELGFSKHTEAFEKLGELLGQKKATIKNMRDEFDPYFDNGRKGWYQRELRGTRKEVFDKYAGVSDAELTEVVKGIIAVYSGAVKSSQEPSHTRIKIGSNHMKEIRSK